MPPLHVPLLTALAVSLAWTTAFSMSSTAGVRGYRNLGILASYVCLIVFLFRTGWQTVAVTWGLFAVCGGLIYTAWETLQRVTTPENQPKPKVGVLHFIPALALWPVMIPEALEYSLATVGVLKAKPPSTPPRNTA